MNPRTGRFGAYTLERLLGEGGMGSVYLAHHEELDRPVALKLLGERVRDDAEWMARFRREAECASRLSHPALVKIYDYGDVEGEPYLAMELVPGRTLAERLGREGALPAGHVLVLLRALLDALAACHDAGIVHRDVTPANVLLDDSGGVRLLDLGLARPLERTALTRPGIFLGTPAYIAPEAVLGEPVGPQSDVWQAALVAREAVVGAPAFAGDSIAEVLRRVASGPPPAPIPTPGPDGEVLRRFLARALAMSPRDRWPHARPALSALDALADEVAARRSGHRAPIGSNVRLATSSRPASTEARREPGSGQAPRPGPIITALLAAFVIAAILIAARGAVAPSPAPPSGADTAQADLREVVHELLRTLEERVTESDVKSLRTKMRHRVKPRDVHPVLTYWQDRYRRDLNAPSFAAASLRWPAVRDTLPDDGRVSSSIRGRLLRAIERLEDLNHLIRQAFGDQWRVPLVELSGGRLGPATAPPAGLTRRLVLRFADAGTSLGRSPLPPGWRPMIAPGPSMFACADDPLAAGTLLSLPKRTEFLHPLHPTGGRPARRAWVGMRLFGGRSTEKLAVSVGPPDSRTDVCFVRGVGTQDARERWYEIDPRPLGDPAARLAIAFEYYSVMVIPAGITLDWLCLLTDDARD